VILQAKEMIAWYAGENAFTFRGGFNRKERQRSEVTVNSNIAVRRVLKHNAAHNHVPPLSKRELFLRDGHLYLYCGNQFPEQLLTRDHLVPLSRDGTDTWKNVVTACKSCNHPKGARTPKEAGMTLVAVPYVPNRSKYPVLPNRLILTD